jgi:hypothetical protein
MPSKDNCRGQDFDRANPDTPVSCFLFGTATNPAAPVVKQTPEYRAVCTAIAAKVGNGKVWRKVYRRHLERAVAELGEAAMLALIASLDFRDVSYLFSTKNGMCLLDRKVEEHRKAAGVGVDFDTLAGELAGKWVKP